MRLEIKRKQLKLNDWHLKMLPTPILLPDYKCVHTMNIGVMIKF